MSFGQYEHTFNICKHSGTACCTIPASSCAWTQQSKIWPIFLELHTNIITRSHTPLPTTTDRTRWQTSYLSAFWIPPGGCTQINNLRPMSQTLTYCPLWYICYVLSTLVIIFSYMSRSIMINHDQLNFIKWSAQFHRAIRKCKSFFLSSVKTLFWSKLSL